MMGRLDYTSHFHDRNTPARVLEQRWQPMIAGVALGAEAQHPALAPGHSLYFPARALKLAAHDLRRAQQAFAGRREDHLLAQPAKQGRPQAFLDDPQLM